jgi:hypothetical protein
VCASSDSFSASSVKKMRGYCRRLHITDHHHSEYCELSLRNLRCSGVCSDAQFQQGIMFDCNRVCSNWESSRRLRGRVSP